MYVNGHIMRKDTLGYLAVTGKVVGKRARGRRRALIYRPTCKVNELSQHNSIRHQVLKESSLLLTVPCNTFSSFHLDIFHFNPINGLEELLKGSNLRTANA